MRQCQEVLTPFDHCDFEDVFMTFMLLIDAWHLREDNIMELYIREQSCNCILSFSSLGIGCHITS